MKEKTQLPTREPPVKDAERTSVLAFDWREWLPHLADADMSDAQKKAMIEALWAIVLGFVDLGFEVKAAEETCGETIDLKVALAAAVLGCEQDEEDAA
ncbi:MAG: hypothetical protein AAF092_10015 [Pseudomonadota bacterium]